LDSVPASVETPRSGSLPASAVTPGSGSIPTALVERAGSPADVARAKSPSRPPPLSGAQLPPPPDRAKSPSRPPPLSGAQLPPPPDRAKSPSRPSPLSGAQPPPPDRAKSPSRPSPLSGAQLPPPPDRAKSPSQPPPIDRAKSPTRPPPPRPLDSFGGETEIDPSPGGMFAERQPLAASSPPAPRPPTSPPPSPRPPTLPPPAPASPLHVAATRPRAGSAIEPPPTRIQRPEALVDRPFAPPQVNPVPEIPEPGLVNAARYAYQFALARWQRRGAIKTLGIEIKQDTEALDQVLGALGRAARGARVEGRVFSAENAAISAAEERVATLAKESSDVEARKAEESAKFVEIERERNQKLALAERMVEEAQRELQHLEAQRRSLRDKRKELERRQKAYLKHADDHDRQAGAAPLGDQRQELRRAAESHRKEAAALEPDKQEIDRRLASLERPINETTARLDAAKAELDAAKRSLSDAREGHTHRLAELDAEQKRKAHEIGLAEAEIQRRLVTLGTLVNLNRIEDPRFAELYQRIDRIRGAITARTTEIEKLTAEREAYDRGTLVRGVATIGGAFLALIALIVILRAVL
jgi:hypothetical protein